jgi:hypothetical protein
MKLAIEDDDENADRIDLGAVALVGMMIGALLALAGLLQPHPLLSTIADVYDANPSLTADQTLFLGALLFAAGAALHAWRVQAEVKRR